MEIPILLRRLRDTYPDAACALTHHNPFQLLVATILSAQCTDARVNMVTPGLFKRYPDARTMSRASQESLEEIIRSTGFYRNKAKSIRAASQRIVDAFGGTVPRTMDELLTLPGVARKTANVVLGVAYGIADGVVVDTHVERIAKRLGLSRGKTAEEVERDLMRVLPREEWIHFAHLLIFHGRRTCIARKPKCAECAVRELCPSEPYFRKGRTPPWERKRGAARAKPARAKRAGRAVKRTKAAAPARRRAVRRGTGRKQAAR
jgi:endonuclease-3